ncbi:MAG: hypothetical protein SNG14_07745 [Rikenellaceae bacterium]
MIRFRPTSTPSTLHIHAIHSSRSHRPLFTFTPSTLHVHTIHSSRLTS